MKNKTITMMSSITFLQLWYYLLANKRICLSIFYSPRTDVTDLIFEIKKNYFGKIDLLNEVMSWGLNIVDD